MKITFEPYSGGTFTASSDAEHISEVCELFKGLLVQSGYHPTTVDDYIDTECKWFPETADTDPKEGAQVNIINGCKDEVSIDYFDNEEENMN